ncbi:MAG TPA: hypothetical protein VFE47_32005 [Tepidisphaeraceae bacterium]|jgi:hypothetical protein|nr:hypothetical protein [Tepidisphaeraceae bacterium]
MEPPQKRTRRLIYALTELESALVKAGRPLSAESFGTLLRRASSIRPQEFVNEARETIEAVLLGERDIGPELIDSLLGATSLIDEILIGLEGANGR